MERARRLLTLDGEHERAIHALCSMADTACWTLVDGSAAERLHIQECLRMAWLKVSQQVMP